MRVRYMGVIDEQVKWGGNDDPRKHLVEGNEYIVTKQDIRTWHTKIELEGFPGLVFNDTSFTYLMKTKEQWLSMPRRELDAAIYELLTGKKAYRSWYNKIVTNLYGPEIPYYSTDLDDAEKLLGDQDTMTVIYLDKYSREYLVHKFNPEATVRHFDLRLAICLAFLEAHGEVEQDKT